MAPIINPQFHAPPTLLQAIKAQLNSQPLVVQRPLVIITGYHSPSVPARVAAKLLAEFNAISPDSTLIVSHMFATKTEDAISIVSRSIRARGWESTPVDVIGISMGGLIARALSLHNLAQIKRLFTLATPHLGASFSQEAAPDPAAIDMCFGSPFLRALDSHLGQRPYELVCYATLRDWLVGARNTAPEGIVPHWVDPISIPARFASHFFVSHDRRIMADIALRLRGLNPISSPGDPPPRN